MAMAFIIAMCNKDAMKEPWLREVVPAQHTGQSSFTHSRINCRNYSHAQSCFRIAAERLVHINQWNDYAGKATASFQLFDETGNAINRPVMKNDYLRINIPGPGNPDEGGDWVQVQQMGERSSGEQQLIFITVKSCPNPLTSTSAPTHFFDQPATSTFVIFRKQLSLMAAVFGRNEHPNQKSRNIITRIRNFFVYLGARLGLANLQWKALTHGLLYEKEP
ncbi:hypothetical protein A4D02_26790 [Niastella koreensis]|uniref:Uncharacterized protein n=3 Tax=Niastella koreensis TaxID=354356 RepID=G8TEM8_NIAKG|nr:hypothetical protein Niako_3120 [Niastella koreensis GR20-10]OQP50048.1 hypothetical protein A4D02_26790 [Niastella koreensis]